MASETTYCGTATEDTAVGTVSFSDDSNITAEDGAEAVSGTGSGTRTTHYMTATNFGSSIPAGATIDGVEFRMKCRHSGSDVIDNSARPVLGGTVQGDELALLTQWPSFGSPADRNYGDPTEDWSLAWTPTNINASDSGFAIAADITNFSAARIDVIERTVYYTEGGGGGPTLEQIERHYPRGAARGVMRGAA